MEATTLAEQVNIPDLFESIMTSPTASSIIACDRDRKILTWNAGARKNYGYLPNEVLGRDSAILHPPEDVASGAVDRLHDEVLRTGQVETTLERLRKDGSRFQARVTLSRRDSAEGRPVGYLLMSQDVSEELRLSRELNLKLAELEKSTQIIERQRDEMLELSCPVIELWSEILAVPLVGTMDSTRTRVVTEALLNAIADTKARVVILDVSGVPTIDTEVAQNIIRTTEAARLMGSVTIISGIRPATAQTIVHLGISLGNVQTRSSLRAALVLAFQELGLEPFRSSP